jgi:V8-like Glu-specific endopeptidase
MVSMSRTLFPSCFLRPLLLFPVLLFCWSAVPGARSEKVKEGPDVSSLKGFFTQPISPGECVDETLQAGDQSFSDGTYYDLYALSWGGGDLQITLDSPDFDEYLIVIDPQGSRTDVDSFSTSPEVFSRTGAAAGNYSVYANSFNIDTGAYELCINGTSGPSPTPTASPTPIPCDSPTLPTSPNPPNGQSGVSVDTDLAWNTAKSEKVIYGVDNRMEVYQVSDLKILEAAASTVMLVESANITANGNGTYTLDSQTFNQSYSNNLCADEPYRDQPVPGRCSGFLVGPDLIATAGHCITSENECSNNVFVFGFDMQGPGQPKLTLPASDVYFCQGIVGRVQDGVEDWALIRLDREVTGRDPLPIRRENKIPDGQSVTVIGHPVGLPKKIAGGANVRSNNVGQFFVANLDTYGGNSGSPVFNSDTWEVEGVLIRGENDFISSGGCTRSQVCADNACRGEDCTRTNLFAHLVPQVQPAVTYDVYFGTCGNLNYLGTTADTLWNLGTLLEGTTYCWRVDAKNACGTTVGPVWSFTTAGGNPQPTATATATATPTATPISIPSPTFTPLATPVPTAYNPATDVNGDKTVDQDDLLMILKNWKRRVDP